MKHWRETAEILERVAELASRGGRCALATVVRISGSSYRRPGAKLLIEEDGPTRGGVSGGCLEADVREIALHVMRSGVSQLLHYDIGSDTTPCASTSWRASHRHSDHARKGLEHPAGERPGRIAEKLEPLE